MIYVILLWTNKQCKFYRMVCPYWQGMENENFTYIEMSSSLDFFFVNKLCIYEKYLKLGHFLFLH